MDPHLVTLEILNFNADFEFIIANKKSPKIPSLKESEKTLANRRETWLKEINDAIKFEQAYLRVKVKDKEYD